MLWFLLEIDLIVFDILLANLAFWEIIAIYGVIMIFTYMMFSMELTGLRKLMYDEDRQVTFRNKIAKIISIYGMGLLGIGIIIKYIFGSFTVDISNSMKAFGFLLLWVFANIVVIAIIVFIGLPYFLQAYYKWKYSEEYREWEGKSVEEWYGKRYLKKHPELLQKKIGNQSYD